MKKIIFTVMASIAVILCLCSVAFASYSPDVNVGGDTGSVVQDIDTSNDYWGKYLQGVRVSIYKVSTHSVVATADYSNLTNDQMKNYGVNQEDIAKNWFGYTSKLSYRNGKSLSQMPKGTYSVRNFKADGATVQFPLVVLDSGEAGAGNQASEIKKFFSIKAVAQGVADDFGIPFETLCTKDYKILLEPVVYIHFKGQWWAFSATEAAVYQKTFGNLTATMGKLTAKILPISLFLERNDTDVGISAYTGGTTAYFQPATIIDQLGIGIISFYEMYNPEGQKVCCDCDEWCPCKYKDNGTKIDGECLCFDDTKHQHDHPEKIPCTPSYPSDCLCALGTFTIKKTDENGKFLPGATFTIKNTRTGQVLTGTTDSKGILTFSNIHIGSWLVTETGVPDGYAQTFSPTTYTVLAGKTTTTTIVNEKKSQAVETPSGDNIIYGYQLTKSFTNSTNFDKQVDFPANSQPSISGCNGNYSRGYSIAYGYSISVPYGHVTSSWVEVPAHSYVYTVTHTTTDAKGNKTTTTEYKTAHVPNYYGWIYCHDNQHIYDYTWTSGDVTVLRSAYLNPKTMFTDTSAMSRYKIMHYGSNYKLTFNTESSYVVSRLTNLFKELTSKTWISHRNGGLTKQSQEIKLARYMSTQNAGYISFYKTYTGKTPNSSNSNASNSSNYKTINDITTTTKHGGVCEREYTGIYCNEYHRSGMKHAANTTTKATQTYKYSVEGSYRANARTLDTSTNKVLSGTNSDGYVYKVIQVPSNQFTFYPTYRMWYTDQLGANNVASAWMLSGGRRTIKATDAIKVETPGGETDVWAPWSRDWTDKYTEDSVYGSETSRGYSVIKSGMVVKAVCDSAPTITITAAFNVQDPSYAPEELKSTVEAQNRAKAAEMQAAVDRIKAEFIGSNAVYGYYSNLWEATSENIVDLSGGALDMPCADYATSESPKTRLNVLKAVTPAAQYYYTSYRGTKDGYVGTVNDLTINGKKYSTSNSTSLMDIYTGTTDTMQYLLDSSITGTSKYYIADGGTSVDPTFSRWYEEYYDGIRVCEIKCVITVPTSSLTTDYVQVHSQLSDSTTEMNAMASNMQAVGYDTALFTDGMFGIGLCAISTNEVSVSGYNFGHLYLYWPAKEFGVRGSVYDLAQNAGQEITRLN